MKNIVTEMKDTFDELISRLDTTKERIRGLQDKQIEIMQQEAQREKRVEKKSRLSKSCSTISELQYNIKNLTRVLESQKKKTEWSRRNI